MLIDISVVTLVTILFLALLAIGAFALVLLLGSQYMFRAQKPARRSVNTEI